MKTKNSNPKKSIAFQRPRQGIATVELLIALPLIATAFVTLMFLAHSSHKKNGDYQRQYVTGMSRHTLQPPKFNNSQATIQLEKDTLGQNLVQGAFPETEIWTTTVSQPLDYVPGSFDEIDWKTSDFAGALYKGTGSPDYRTENMISPSKDKVKALAISATADFVGNMLNSNFGQANEFLSLLSAFSGTAANSNFSQPMQEAKKQLQELRQEQRTKQDELDSRKSELQTERNKGESQDPVEVDRLAKEVELLAEQVGDLQREFENARKIVNRVQTAMAAFTNPKN